MGNCWLWCYTDGVENLDVDVGANGLLTGDVMFMVMLIVIVVIVVVADWVG
jgi:hypothetical protein